MAEWGVIERVTQTLIRLLEQRLRQAAITNVDVYPLTTASFRELSFSTSAVISLLLYQVMENPELRNAPLRKHPDGRFSRQSLPLELCYIVTPWGGRGADPDFEDDSRAALEESRLLGLVLQAFHDHAEVGTAELFEDPTQPVWRAGDNLQIVLESLPVEDHYRIWDASELGYRLSVTYRIRVTSLDSAETISETPVVEAMFEGSP